MSTSTMKILCRYQYDPLDRLTGLKPAEHLDTQRFYQNDELVNEIEGQVELTILRHEAQPLAQRLHIANVTETTLLATDQQRSVLQTLAGTDTQPMAYTAYGHRSTESGLSSLLGFNGERPDPVTGHYLLGQGNRAFNPLLMRFNSPDELSPFGDGGINAYAYCGGDPVNRYDPSGNSSISIIKPWNFVKNLNGLNLSSRTIARTDRPIGLNFSSTALGKKRSVAAGLPPEPEIWNNAPHTYKKKATLKLLRDRTYERNLRQDARKWDSYVKKNPQTSIEADIERLDIYNKALRNLENAKNFSVADKSALNARVYKTRMIAKRSAWKNLKRLKTETQRVRK